ncbi:MAG: methyltransferase domain-containing protein [Chloroflexi bacterium]|nr:methyltransferase domain-containing protein [Chloroflexota bacterium]
MDRWKYFAVTHRDHAICNPTSPAKLAELVELLDLRPHARVLDIACGKGETLVRIAERWGARGVGVDLSPPFVADARELVAARLLSGRIEIIQEDGIAYRGKPGSFDVALCLGASWIFGGYRKTLKALAAFAKPGGLVVSGEPFAYHPAEADQFAGRGLAESAFRSHAGNAAIGAEEGLSLLYTIVSSQDDWDRYQGLQWRAAERFAREHPDDPDAIDVAASQREQRDRYLREERDELGWAIYLFATPGV